MIDVPPPRPKRKSGVTQQQQRIGLGIPGSDAAGLLLDDNPGEPAAFEKQGKFASTYDLKAVCQSRSAMLPSQ